MAEIKEKMTLDAGQVIKMLDRVSGNFEKVSKEMANSNKRTAREIEGGWKKIGRSQKKTSDSHAKETKKMVRHNANVVDSMERLNVSFITKGMFMGIGWQTINAILETVKSSIRDIVTANIELESSMKTIQIVSMRTGRSYAEVMGIISNSMDAFTDRAALMEGTLKLLATSLSTKEIKQFINAVKEGSAAMGMDFNEQLPLITRGFKQLTANILDNIGVTIYLDDVKRRAAAANKVTVAQLTEEQIHRELLNIILEQTAKYTGAYAAQLDTAKGSVARMSTEWKLLTQALSDTTWTKKPADAIANFFAGIREDIEKTKAAEKYPEIEIALGLEGRESIMGDILNIVDKLPGILSVREITLELNEEQIIEYAKAIELLVGQGVEWRKLQDELTVGSIEHAKVTEDLNAWTRKSVDISSKNSLGIGISIERYKELVEEEYDLIKIKKAEEEVVSASTKAVEDNAKKYSEARDEAIKYLEPLIALGENYETLRTSVEDTEEEFAEYLDTLESAVIVSGRLSDVTEVVDSKIEVFTKNIKDSTNKIEEHEASIERERGELKRYRNELEEVNDELSIWLKKSYEGETAAKRRMFGWGKETAGLELQMLPYEKSAKLWEDVTADLERAEEELKRAESKLLKRVEPLVYQEYIKDAEEARKNVEELTEQQKEAGEKLETIGGFTGYQKLEEDLENLNYKMKEQRLIGQLTYDAMRTEYKLTRQEHFDLEHGVVTDVGNMIEVVGSLEDAQRFYKEEIALTTDIITDLNKLMVDERKEIEDNTKALNGLTRAQSDLNKETERYFALQDKPRVPETFPREDRNFLEQITQPRYLPQDIARNQSSSSVTHTTNHISIDAKDRTISDAYDELNKMFNFKKKQTVVG